MKKTLMTLAMTTFVALAAACQPTTPAGGANPGSGANPGTGASSPFPKSMDFVKFTQCLQARAGTTSDQKAQFDTWINEASKVSDADWPARSAQYADYVKAIDAQGCK
jgi:hypothetical protein